MDVAFSGLLSARRDRFSPVLLQCSIIGEVTIFDSKVGGQFLAPKIECCEAESIFGGIFAVTDVRMLMIN